MLEDNPMDTPSISILGTQEIIDIAEQDDIAQAPEVFEPIYSALAGHIMAEFRINKDSKRNSGIEDDITRSLEAYNGTYSRKDLARISEEGGSRIFMQLTATKCRNAASWMRDILLSANQKSWALEPTPMADLPKGLKNSIAQSIDEEFSELAEAKQKQDAEKEAAKEQEEKQKAQAEAQGQQAQGAPPQPPQEAMAEAAGPKTKAGKAQETVRELNQEKRDILESTYDEIQKEAKFNMMFMERQIDDQFIEGGYYKALDSFIDDFAIFPTAFQKGPVITELPRLKWVNGVPTVSKDYSFVDKRVSPYDMYPSPEATSLQDGNLCEHLRLTRSEVYNLTKSPKYDVQAIYKVLENSSMGTNTPYWLDTGVESDKADQEMRGDQFEANRNIIHGIHFFGSVSARILRTWGLEGTDVATCHPEKQFEVEAIMLNESVVKCVLNDDPLLRRGYYCASYQNRPGSVWGRSLPMLMDDIQRMCNATARALANNMALASGPQIEIYIDRLADDGEIEQMRPFKIWQLTTDPSGGSGRAVNFFQPTSNAKELLEVYTQFESRADDATGIPRYAYGNEKVGGAATTAGGLAMLFEASSKMVKDAVKNIDQGLIIPRVEYQFYWNVILNEIDFTGDIQVKALGSSTLTVKGAEQMRRNEFLQITANPIDQQIMGEGRAVLLREMSKDLGFVEDIVPSRLDQKKRAKDQAEMAAKEQELKMQEMEHQAKLGNMGAETQIQGQVKMATDNNEVAMMTEQGKNKRHEETIAAKDREIQAFNDQNAYRLMSTTSTHANDTQAKKEMQNKELAVKLQTGSGI